VLVSQAGSVQVGEVVSRTDADTAAFQNRLNSALQKMLDSVAGPGRAVVTTAAELDFDQVETVGTTYDQDPSVGALSERLSRKSYTDDSGGTRYESTTAVRANALNSLRETRRNAPGGVKKLSIAVLVDATAGQTIDLAQLQQLVSVAAGIDPRRGDAISVAAMPLHSGTASTAESTLSRTAAEPAASRRSMLSAAALGLLILILVLAWRRYKRREIRMSAQRDQLQRMRAALEASATAAIAPPTAAIPRHESLERQRMISRSITENPGQAAAVLRGWAGQSR
jgi:flagellar M-ring protein FliF